MNASASQSANPFAKASDREAFVAHVWQEGSAHARNDLPWRFIDDPYAVYVSEAMLQQTQVARVLKHWPRFLAAFPTIDALAAAAPSDVLEQWQGLGYNRRALAMKRAAEECATRYGGAMPCDSAALQELPGIGPATAAGIMAFAYRKPSVYIETNVRAVFIHELFPHRDAVSDRELWPLVEASCSREDPRGWYYALLDYGCYLKQVEVNPSRKSAHYTRQSTFAGSRRQKRAYLVREVLAQPGITSAELKSSLDDEERAAGRAGVDDDVFRSIIDDLVAEGFFSPDGEGYRA